MATNDSASPGKSREAEPDPLINTVLGERYRVERRLSQGGMGVVYRARHVVLDSALAVKVLLKPQSAEDQRRFLQEAKLASLIQHPNTVQIIDFGVLPSGQSYLVMELLRGRTLASELRPGPLDPLRVCRIGKQIAHGLQTVHDQGIVHRDMKPDNVFLLNKDGDADFVKIVDFGIAKSVGGFDNPPVSVQVQEPQADAFAATIAQPSQGASPAAPALALTLDGLGPGAAPPSAIPLGATPAAAGMPLAAGSVAATISGEAVGPVSSTPVAFAATTAQPPVDAKGAMQTSAGRVLGTPHYMAPEQCRAQPVDSRADQYAVGCMLYEMLTGELVFPETSPLQILTKHCEEPPQPLRQRAPQQNIPEVLEAAVLRMLAKSADGLAGA